ncbi:glycoside hydrolase [Flavobacterium akiainvivens]|uniref:Glycoside hydrolase n=1 Tax=Flavobacterium akiainvivens TaxID=1202724 RepID=A0A0M8MFG8_9FLAO|nr:C40 family peptidase [Flavobacterium akiainvivens]KOS05151.1 glycoside hydrolase [Flavobacterium akiainvivens]SFQ51097.1 Cell wall-associated hydrolase, NlpC family [Flavobacterium akiainvivens]
MKILQHTLLLVFGIALLSCKDEIKPQPVPAQPLAVKADTAVALRDSVVAFAKKYMGIKYCYASADPKKGFDCSGFVNYVYKHFNIDLPRSSSGFKSLGKPLKPADFKVGDVLVFYGYRDKNHIGHVGIVCEANGMQSKFIHASSGSEMAVTISELGSDMYTRRFYKCVNPFTL